MDKTNIFIIKVLLLLWVVCIVLCEHQKRDVHRIVIKEKIPRGPKKGHSHTHEHDHKRSRHSSKNKRHNHKHKTKTHSNSYERSSEEDNSYSTEDNFQKHKGRKSYHSDSKKSHSSPPLHISQDFEETKYTPFKYDSKFAFQNEWIPLSSEQVHHSHETHRDRHKRKQQHFNSRKNYLTSLKPPPIDLTTSYPFQFEASSPFPPLIAYPNAFSNFNLNQKIIESNQSPLIGTIEHPGIQFSELNYNRLKNHKTSYEVTELTPADSNTNTFISVPDNISEDTAEVTTKISKLKKEEERSTQQPIRSRGRANFRGKNKA